MQRFIVVVMALAIIGLCCTESAADFRCRGRRIIAPVFHHAPCHEVVHHAAAVVPAVAVVPQPVFIFQNLQGFPGLPQSAYTPQQSYQPPASFQVPQGFQGTQPGLQLSDAQLDRIATLLHAKLTGGAVAQNTLLQAPPALADDTPVQPAAGALVMSQAIVNDIGAKCSACHMDGTKTSGGLSLFDKDRNFNPTKGGIAYASPERLWQRAQEGSMPPSAATDPSKRLNPESIAFLRNAVSQ